MSFQKERELEEKELHRDQLHDDDDDFDESDESEDEEHDLHSDHGAASSVADSNKTGTHPASLSETAHWPGARRKRPADKSVASGSLASYRERPPGGVTASSSRSGHVTSYSASQSLEGGHDSAGNKLPPEAAVSAVRNELRLADLPHDDNNFDDSPLTARGAAKQSYNIATPAQVATGLLSSITSALQGAIGDGTARDDTEARRSKKKPRNNLRTTGNQGIFNPTDRKPLDPAIQTNPHQFKYAPEDISTAEGTFRHMAGSAGTTLERDDFLQPLGAGGVGEQSSRAGSAASSCRPPLPTIKEHPSPYKQNMRLSETSDKQRSDADGDHSALNSRSVSAQPETSQIVKAAPTTEEIDNDTKSKTKSSNSTNGQLRCQTSPSVPSASSAQGKIELEQSKKHSSEAKKLCQVKKNRRGSPHRFRRLRS